MRVIAAFLLLPLAVGVERFCWYAARSTMFAHAHGSDALAIYRSTASAMLVGSVVAGVLAALLLPRVVLVAAAVCAAAGYVLAAGDETFEAGLLCAALGAGALKTCLYGIAFIVMPTPRLRTLYILLTYLVVNVAAFLGPLAGGAALDHEVSLAVLGVLVAVGSLPAVAVIVVDKLAQRPPAAPTADPGRAVLAAMAMAGAMFPLYAANSAAGRALHEGAGVSSAAFIGGAMTLVTMAGLVGVGTWLLSRGAREDTAPTALSLLVGTALALAAAGALTALVPVRPAGVVAALFFAMAEVAAPLALARGVANHHPRAATLVMAFTLAFTWGGSRIGDAYPTAALAVGALLLAAASAALIIVGARFDRWLDAPKPARASWLTGQSQP